MAVPVQFSSSSRTFDAVLPPTGPTHRVLCTPIRLYDAVGSRVISELTDASVPSRSPSVIQPVPNAPSARHSPDKDARMDTIFMGKPSMKLQCNPTIGPHAV